MNSPKGLLISARAMITDFNHWTQRRLARNRQGLGTDPDSMTAYAFCADGALIRCQQSVSEYRAAANLLQKASRRLFNIDYITLNDAGSALREVHASILQAFDAAIADAEAPAAKPAEPTACAASSSIR